MYHIHSERQLNRLILCYFFAFLNQNAKHRFYVLFNLHSVLVCLFDGTKHLMRFKTLSLEANDEGVLVEPKTKKKLRTPTVTDNRSKQH